MSPGSPSADRPVVHLDAAGSARVSPEVLAAQMGHLRREAQIGGYPAEGEALPVVEGLRRRLAGLVGATDPGVVIVENATRAFADLLAAWPFRRGQQVGVLRSEYGSNRMVLEALAHRQGLRLIELAADADGRLVVEQLEALLPELALVTFPVVASHRGVVQPATAVADACRRAGVPLVLDVAQAAGQLDMRQMRADAFVGTSRKWLRGPRGVGFLVVERSCAEQLGPALPNLSSATWGATRPEPVAGAARFEIGETPVAAVVGLAAALEGLHREGPTAVFDAIAGQGRSTRRRLAGIPGWRVLEPLDEPSGIVTLRHERLQAEEVQRTLLAGGILTSAIPTARAPRDLPQPVLRASTHVYSSEDDVEQLAQALTALGG